ncbi:MAG: UDP-N-acetylmuramoyl-L-alanyl-D-glutamate--2,6-diaminopimelate ligase [Holosporaceae bacterium]|nr:UDP-N-acetylmuramoyl-L-alanyl-D-glutamate--2,6-diaminopimelate ligase [Holosporaceae bacterium]
MKKLKELLSFELSAPECEEIAAVLCDNSEKAVPGCMFITLASDGKARELHIREAISRGAKYILQPSENGKNYSETRNGVLFISVKDVRRESARVASVFFERKPEKIAAVTGTNGKTSTVEIARQIWTGLGINAAGIGTLGVITGTGREKLPGNMTSPDCLELNGILSRLSENGITHVAMEASSQGIDQHRIDGLSFDVCAFTNFSQDHSDYHRTSENYWNAKERLFSEAAPGGSVFVVNSDDERSQRICRIAADRKIRCVSYGLRSDDIKILEINSENSRRRVKVFFMGREFSFLLPLPGDFQIYNSLCAAAVCYFAGSNAGEIFSRLEELRPIEGRMELITRFNSADIYVDYAHTPAALEAALMSLRARTKNRIITVFGCGGNRDRQKRPLMGKIADMFSDVTIVTDDNPRNENPAQIRKMITEGCPNAAEIGDRKTAIEFAMKMLSDGDALLIAGKGHETFQLTEDGAADFSDGQVVLNMARK